MLAVNNLSSVVGTSNMFKLRICDKPYLREDDKNIDLKNIHEEWELIREKQSTRIPLNLWNAVIDSLVGETTINTKLPDVNRQNYDDKFGAYSSYGLCQGQIFVNGAVSVDTVKYVIENTKVYKYDNELNKIPDIISFNGFDINSLSSYLSSPQNIRKFMVDLWRFAKPKQINEIFFALLYDALSKNLQLEGILKTSLISLDNVVLPN
jgi:hypothetical protein